MKGIVRKRLLALLSAAGLAGTATSAAGQVVKGSEPSEKTKAESSIKYGKAQQESKAAASGAAKKERKAGGEQQAAQDVVNEKIGPEHVVHKHIAGVKYEKKTSSDAASKDAAKLTKVTKESTVAQEDPKKTKAGTAEANAVKNEAGKKHRKAGAEQDALTVKQKTRSQAAIQRKAGGVQQGEAGKKMDQASPK